MSTIVTLTFTILAVSSARPDGVVERLLWIVAASITGALITGIVMLIGFYSVQKRFLNNEFPAVVESLQKTQLGQDALRMDINQRLDRIYDSIHELDKSMAEQRAAVNFHDRRISRLEARTGDDPK